MDKDLKIAIWRIANLALELHDDEISVAQFEQSSFEALSKVKNLNEATVKREQVQDEEPKNPSHGIDSTWC